MLARRSAERSSGMIRIMRKPRIAATIASAMPVLPLVASISVSPGLMRPRSSALRIIHRAGRSFTEPAGLLPSNLHSTTLVVSPGSRLSRTSGVLPTVSSMVFHMACSIACRFPRQQGRNVSLDAFGDRQERRRVARASKRAQVGLGEALVPAFERLRERNVLDRALRQQFGAGQRRLARRLAAGVDDGLSHVVERLRAPGPDVENAGELRALEEVQVDVDDVLDRHEIAPLLAVRVAARTLEELHAALGAVLVEEVPRHGSHASLVG